MSTTEEGTDIREPLPDQSYLILGRGIVKKFGGLTALNSVDFHVRAGESVGIMGPNGSGKTTLFNVLTGFLRADAGTIHWRGTEVTKEAAHRRARRGMIRTFQQSMVMPGMSVRENIEVAIGNAALGGREPATTEEIVEYLGLASARDTLSDDLSWGEARLLGIGLALTMKPGLLLMDEPFAGLNLLSIERVMDLIFRLKTEGYSLCIVDHKVPHLLPLCDRLMVLVNGVVLAEGDPDDVVATREVQEAYLGLS
jgi:ABC-type branched-subunit amino acid transport system ATPase component